MCVFSGGETKVPSRKGVRSHRFDVNTVLTRYLLNEKGKRSYLHNILDVLMELFIVRMFTFLMSPQAYRLIELGNTFWL